MTIFKKSILLFITILLMTSCSSISSINDEKDSNDEVQEEVAVDNTIYPYQLEQEEFVLLMNELKGVWLSHEVPYTRHFSDKNGEWDEYVGGHIITFKTEEQEGNTLYEYIIGNDHLGIGRINQICNATKTNGKTYILETKNLYLYDPVCDKEGDGNISTLIISFIDTKEGQDKMMNVTISEEDNREVEMYYPTNSQTSINSYYDWLEENGYMLDFDWSYEIYPNGLADGSVSIYKAKEVVESVGFVFDTDIPESEWENPKKYYRYDFYVDGERVDYLGYAIQKGATAFFHYY